MVAMQLEQKGIYTLSVTTTPRAFPKTAALAKGNRRIRTALGLHPQLAAERHTELDLFETLLEETNYVGEIGLDGGRELRKSQEIQARVFEAVLKMSGRAGGKVLTVHSRHAARPVLDCLAQYPDAGSPIMHWFTGTKSGIDASDKTGLLVFHRAAYAQNQKGARGNRFNARNRVLTETDAPFPAQDIASALTESEKILATIWGTSAAGVEATLLENLKELTRVHGIR